MKRPRNGWVGPAAVAVAVRPRLWGVVVRQGWRMAGPGWWRRWPPVPRPAPEYLRFRFQTAFGDRDGGPEPAEVVAYLEWCRRFPA
ncbi:MAG: hypothetical protein ACR2KK_17690 [Acidimicrobiales bacterium]